MRTVEERLKSYEPLWENWTYTGEFLGEGAMSSVFEIQSTAMGFRELAALKIITVKRNFRGEVKIPENALNEIKILRALSGCANIVQYHDSTQRQIYDDNGVLEEIDILIKMEKLKPLSEGDKFSTEKVTKLAKDMCNALMHAMEYGIIHRDIKPQNIFVDKDGTYKLGDFGIAKIVSDFSQNFTTNIGTMAYTAPEVYQNTTGTYDISSDIYSLGLVLYVFLNNGYLPFSNNSGSLHDAIAKRLAGAPFPSPANGDKNLKAIVMRACNNDVTKRYRTPAEMLEDLELLSTGGKKLVADPFATLDANADEYESEAYSGSMGVTVKTSVTPTDASYSPPPIPPAGGLKINLGGKEVKSSPKAPVTPVSVAPSSGGLKINMGKKAMDGSVATAASAVMPPPSVKKTAVSSEDAGSRLKINMGGKSAVPPPSASAVAPKPEKKEENSGDSSFFSTPDLL